MALNEAQLKIDLTRDEAKRLKVYKCSAAKNTIAIGRNLDDVGLSAAELQMIGASMADILAGKVTLTDEHCDVIYANDIRRCKAELDRNCPWWKTLPEPAARGLINMLFNMGWPRLSGFKNMLKALEDRDFSRAAVEAENSKWFGQVGDRAKRICKLFQSCA